MTKWERGKLKDLRHLNRTAYGDPKLGTSEDLVFCSPLQCFPGDIIRIWATPTLSFPRVCVLEIKVENKRIYTNLGRTQTAQGPRIYVR